MTGGLTNDVPAHIESSSPNHDPEARQMIDSFTSKVADLMKNRLKEGKGEEKVARICARLLPKFDNIIKGFDVAVKTCSKEILQDELEALQEETAIQKEDQIVAGKTVEMCGSLVSKIKRMREHHKEGEQINAATSALKRELNAVSETESHLSDLDTKSLQSVLSKADELIKDYNDLMKNRSQ